MFFLTVSALACAQFQNPNQVQYKMAEISRVASSEVTQHCAQKSANIAVPAIAASENAKVTGFEEWHHTKEGCIWNEQTPSLSVCKCDNPECLAAGARDCPFGAPEHYWHDGCPTCYEAAQKSAAEAAHLAKEMQKHAKIE